MNSDKKQSITKNSSNKKNDLHYWTTLQFEQILQDSKQKKK